MLDLFVICLSTAEPPFWLGLVRTDRRGDAPDHVGGQRATARSDERWSCCWREKIRGSADRDEADLGGRGDVTIGLDDGRGDGDRLSGRRRTSDVTGADALAGLVRVTRVRRGLSVALMIGGCRGLGRAGVQPLDNAPGDAGSEQDKGERKRTTAPQER
jgi:hypothetical protein